MTNIVVPELGESVVEARVVKWLKNAGDRVSAGDPLVELETEKIDLEVSADRAGVLSTIKHEAGADVEVGGILATLEEVAGGAAAKAPEAPKADVPKAAETPKGNGAKAAQVAAEVRATPTAKNVAREQKVDLEAVTGSGARGRVT